MSEHSARPGTPLDILVLAAGLGTRMKSSQAKVLHQLGGQPLIVQVCRAAASLKPRMIYVVIGYQAREVKTAVEAEFGNAQVKFVDQLEQRGTGDAVTAAKDALAKADSTILILSGDVPMVRAETLGKLTQQHAVANTPCTMVTVRLDNPTGYGRVVRDEAGRFAKIVEHKDASEDERQIREVNAGIYCFESQKLFTALEQVKPSNKQGEYYLTDVPRILREDGHEVGIYQHHDAREVSGVNTRAELAEFENLLRRGTIRRLMLDEGVTFIDPSHSYIS